MFEAGKEYRTRDGRRAWVYWVGPGVFGDVMIHGAVESRVNDKSRVSVVWPKSGRINDGKPAIDDLMPLRRECWVCFDRTGSAIGYQRSAPTAQQEVVDECHSRTWVRMVEADE